MPEQIRPMERDELEALLRAPNDEELSRIVRDAADALDGYEDRMARAYGIRLMQLEAKSQFLGYHEKVARGQIEEAIHVLMNVSDALKHTEEGLRHAEAKREFDRIWGRAKDKYQRWAGAQRKDPTKLITPFHALSDDEKADWFALADDRVPPTWDELTQGQREAYAARQHMSTAPDRARKDHAMRRARNLRRRAYRQIEHASPFTVYPNPTQRMENVTQFAQMLSERRERRAKGQDVNDLEIAIWEEHYRRALHAYTKPFEPYPVAP